MSRSAIPKILLLCNKMLHTHHGLQHKEKVNGLRQSKSCYIAYCSCCKMEMNGSQLYFQCDLELLPLVSINIFIRAATLQTSLNIGRADLIFFSSSSGCTEDNKVQEGNMREKQHMKDLGKQRVHNTKFSFTEPPSLTQPTVATTSICGRRALRRQTQCGGSLVHCYFAREKIIL